MTVSKQGLSPETIERDYPYLYFGAHVNRNQTVFRVYAPNATGVWLMREGNNWSQKAESLTKNHDGVWEITIEEDLTYCQYKYWIENNSDYLETPYQMARIDPFSPQLASSWNGNGTRNFNSIVGDRHAFDWTHKKLEKGHEPMSIYEMHLSTFHDGNYRDIAHKIVEHVGYLGFTHVQIMPPLQTPIHESWGYLVGCPYAIYERHGTIDDFKYLVNHCHKNGIGVIVDVPLGFGIQDWDCGLGNYDGTDLYHHSGAKGWNNQWQSRIYNIGDTYVKNYLAGLCTYLHHELGIDGVRIDAVSAQIFYDYDRGFWDWPKNDREVMPMENWDLFNSLGGDRYFDDRGYWLSEAVDFAGLLFLRDLHARLNYTAPDFFTIAEESRRVFPRLACSVEEGGLGFTYAQNMGEMHRIRKYLQIPVGDRKIEHIEILIHNNSAEKMVNAMNTHDECANGKTRLLTELGSHIPLIGLAALCWFRPGAPMIFQGDEFGEEGYFDISHPLNWSRTGEYAALHEQQITNNFYDLNKLLNNEPALARQEISSMIRNGSNNERKWFSFIRWGSNVGFESNRWEDHEHDIIFVRNETHYMVECKAEIYVPVGAEYQVIYNSIDQRYIGNHDYNQHDPYWIINAGGQFMYIDLLPYQNIAFKLKPRS
uniref:1,4-alpha-glucan branching enzyme n=1 Tax=Cyanobacterium sp. CLg1 TaxID=197335 RepID=J7FN11_9CHRO|nr:starch branching enzyme 3 [Cyanobacterium sp. CLg1]